jgi:hypothetical protein
VRPTDLDYPDLLIAAAHRTARTVLDRRSIAEPVAA